MFRNFSNGNKILIMIVIPRLIINEGSLILRMVEILTFKINKVINNKVIEIFMNVNRNLRLRKFI